MTAARPHFTAIHAFRASILTLYPEMFPGPLGVSLPGEALAGACGRWRRATSAISATAGTGPSTTPRPAAGPGMVMRADVLAEAIDAACRDDARPRLLMSPRGRRLAQAHVRELAAGEGVVIVCGRFEGVDERVIEARGLQEVSIGDYVLSGGELGAMVLIDACVRLLPGVMGEEASGGEESFENGLLEYPHYTRPREWEGRGLPEALLSGDHARIATWRREAGGERSRRERRWQREALTDEGRFVRPDTVRSNSTSLIRPLRGHLLPEGRRVFVTDTSPPAAPPPANPFRRVSPASRRAPTRGRASRGRRASA